MASPQVRQRAQPKEASSPLSPDEIDPPPPRSQPPNKKDSSSPCLPRCLFCCVRGGIILGRLLLFLLFLVFVVPLFLPSPTDPNAPTEFELALRDPDSRFVRLHGYDIHYKESGQGEPAFVLLHGFSASLFSWRKMLHALSPYGRVIAFDRIGMGLSSHPVKGNWSASQPNPYSPQMQPEFTAALLDALGIQKAIVLGNSQGGSVAMRFALKYPQRLHALVVVSADWITTGIMPSAQYSWLWDLPQLRVLGVYATRALLGPQNAAYLIRLAWHDPTKISDHEINEAKRAMQVRNFAESLWEYTAANEPSTLPEAVRAVGVPTLVISGDDDNIVPPSDADLLALRIPGAQRVLLKECGHMPQEEQPEQFFAAVLAFIRRHGLIPQ